MKPHVLVVDDTDGNRYAVSRLLRGADMQVSEAGSGLEALRLAEGIPDLIVLDINLPDMSGYEVCRQIKSREHTAFIPVLHLSASYTASADRAYGLEAGADAYLTHPIEPALFIATARALLRAGRAENESRRAAREWTATFDAIRDPIFLLWFDGSIKRCNRAAGRLVGERPDDMIGHSWTEVIARMGGAPDNLLHRATYTVIHNEEVRLAGCWYSVTTNHAEGAQLADAFVVCVMTDISERRAAQEEREKLLASSVRARIEADAARGEAETANRAKADFLAIMSHELRTPLNAIGGYTDLLALGVRGPVNAEQLHDLGRISRSQVTLISLINDLLGFAKLESGSVHYDIADVDVEHVMDAAHELMESQMERKSLRFVRERQASLLVRADSDKVQQILVNLLSNAVKFTAAGGTIAFTREQRGQQVLLHIRDTGRGIPADKLASIFDPFMQVDQRLVREHQGVGLGLAISRDLARAMQGELTATSVVGDGSTFTLVLPASVPAARPEAVV